MWRVGSILLRQGIPAVSGVPVIRLPSGRTSESPRPRGEGFRTVTRRTRWVRRRVVGSGVAASSPNVSISTASSSRHRPLPMPPGPRPAFGPVTVDQAVNEGAVSANDVALPAVLQNTAIGRSVAGRQQFVNLDVARPEPWGIPARVSWSAGAAVMPGRGRRSRRATARLRQATRARSGSTVTGQPRVARRASLLGPCDRARGG